jgi:diguanylate cyclase (GGDEF)-like protein
VTEDRRRSSALAAAHQAGRRVSRYVWGFRLLTSLLAFGGLTFVLVVPRDDTPLHYVLTTAAFLIPLSAGLLMAAITRSMNVNLERALRGQLAVRTARLQDIAMRDELTGLFNRRYFYECCQQEMDGTRLWGGSLGLVLLDVDGLKAINDTFGHKVGDKALAVVGQVLAKHTRACDVAARIGGDEFAVLMPEASKADMPGAVKRLQDALEGAMVHESNGSSLRLQVSLGASGYPWGGSNVDEIVQAADGKLYSVKARHRRHGETAGAERDPLGEDVYLARK